MNVVPHNIQTQLQSTLMLKCFHKFKMKPKLAKCEFGRGKIQFLGHIINHQGIRALPEKTEEIWKIKAPRNADKGMCISWTVELLLQIHTSFHRLDASNTKASEKECKIQMVRRM